MASIDNKPAHELLDFYLEAGGPADVAVKRADRTALFDSRPPP